MQTKRGLQVTTTNVGLHNLLRTTLQRLELTPVRVTSIYLLFGFAALFFSDVVLLRYFDEPVLSRIQAVKGGLEVVVTGGLILGLTQGSRLNLEWEAQRLERQREKLQVLHRVMRHNLRNDLNKISGHAELLEANTESADCREWCEIILDNVDALMAYTEKAARIQSITDEQGEVARTVDLAEAVPRIIRENERVSESVAVSIETPDYAAVEANHMLDVALDELVSNAIEHTDSSTPELAVSVDRAAGPTGTTQVSITDNGPGIHPETLEVLEEGREDQLLHMNGIGLWMVYWTVIESGGSLDIDTGESGTEVTLTLPTSLSIREGSMAQAFA